MRHLPIILAALVAVAPATGAQEVYRCTGANGEVAFASKPCGTDASPVVLRSSAPATGDNTAVRAQADLAARGSITLREQQCLRAADDNIRTPAGTRIAGYRARIGKLENALRYAANNQAGATWSSGLRQEIASLQEAITTEEVSAETLAQAAYVRCRETRLREEAAIAEAK